MLLEIGESAARDVVNLTATAADGKTTISWDYASENEKKALVYTVEADGSLSLTAQVNGNSCVLDTDDSATYTVKAQGGVGALSAGKSATAAASGFTIIDTSRTTADEETGECLVYLENTADIAVAARISVMARDKATNEIKKMAAYERILLPEEKDEFSCNVFAQNTIIEIAEN